MARGRLNELFEKILEHVKGFVLALIVIISILGVSVGYKYYRHTQEDPEFCMSCHMMKEAFQEWQRGKHRDVVCQKCHNLSLVEQNQLLVAFIMKTSGPLTKRHGKEKPWGECRKCHLDAVTQGSQTLRQSFGHAKHVFTANVECRACHGGHLHRFRPDDVSCHNCHADKGVHGAGMEAFSCLKCHSFSEKSATTVPREQCLKCHRIPSGTPMAGFPCFKCHKPHGRIRLTSKDCLGQCHTNETKVGQHALHMGKGMACLDCHKAHSWRVGQREGKTLCSRCHAAKDPLKFVY
jgi:nitrate/TMAO reductase-like tetraheme cytochrome c subunit